MTISEKLTTIAENQQKVYEAGQKSIGTTETVTGNPVRLDYVHATEHELDVRLENKNLFQSLAMLQIKNELTFTPHDDGTLAVDGTASATTFYDLGRINLVVGQVYRLSGCADGGSSKTYQLYMHGTTTSKDVYDRGEGKTFTATDDTYLVRVVVYVGTTVEELLFKPMVVLGDTATPYTPHLTDFSGVKVQRYGKNLLHLEGREVVNFGDSSNTTMRTFPGNNALVVGCSVTGYYYPNNIDEYQLTGNTIKGRISATQYYGIGLAVKLYPNTEYSFSCETLVGNVGLAEYDIDGYYIRAVGLEDSKKFTTTASASWGILVVYSMAESGLEFSCTNPQLGLGAIDGNYEQAVAPTEHAANADGTVSGVMSLYPITTLVADGVNITATYYVAGDYQYHRFWDAYQDCGNREIYDMCFAGAGWTPETFKPKYVVRPRGTGNNYMMFARTGVEVLDESVIDTSQCKAFTYSFYNTGALKSVTIDLSSLTAFTSVFNYDGNLETVVMKNVQEACKFTDGFDGCNKLTNLTVTGTIGTSINLYALPLSKDSIMSVFNALSTAATGQTVTFKKTAIEAAFTTDEWDALIATKTNWTYALA